MALYRLDVIIRGNSTISKDEAIKWTKNWVNERQINETNKDKEGNFINFFYADLFDSRTADSWKIFSDEATKAREILNSYFTSDNEEITGVIYTSPYLKGVVREITIDTEDGTKFIKCENKNAKIFLQMEDSLKAIPRVEKQSDDGFNIVIYNGEFFDEDKVKLNCKENPVKVNFLAINK